ncbi:MAG: hypothetical protein AB2807_06770 [Candidatus Sedimenticola endophacoides]
MSGSFGSERFSLKGVMPGEDAAGLELDLQLTPSDMGNNAQARYQAKMLAGTETHVRYGERYSDAVTFNPLYATPGQIEFVAQDFTTPLKLIGPGERVWIKARSAGLCERVAESMVLILTLRDRMVPRYRAVMLTETAPGSGEFRSDPAGILVSEDPGSAITHIDAQVEPQAARSAILAGVSEFAAVAAEYAAIATEYPDGVPEYALQSQRPVVARLTFSGSEAADKPPGAKQFAGSPFMPALGYSAEQQMQIGDIETRARVYYMPGMIRTEIAGSDMASIMRYDRGTLFTLWLKKGAFTEANISGQVGLADGQITSRERLGEQLVNGIPTTHYRFTSQDGRGNGWRGQMWVSAEGIAVKVDAKGGANNMRYQSALSNLHVAEQPARLFEVPAGFSSGMGIWAR